MTEHYKGYEIEISANQWSGGWQPTAKVTSIIGGKGFGLTITGNFKTQAAAEEQALMSVKRRIDEILPDD